MSYEGKGLAGSRQMGFLLETTSRVTFKEVHPVVYGLKIQRDVQGRVVGASYVELEGLEITDFTLKNEAETREGSDPWEIPIAELSFVEFTMPIGTRYMKMAKDQSKDPYGVTEIPYFDASELLSAHGMFENLWKLTSVTFTGTTEHITDMSSMFALNSSLESIPETLNSSACVNMDRMFDYCVKLKSIREDFDTSACTSMRATFRGCRELMSIPLMNTENVVDMRDCFSYCSGVDDVAELNTGACKNMKRMFLGCSNLTELKYFDTSNVESIEAICKGCSLLGRVGNWETGHMTNFDDVFNGCSVLNTAPSFDTSSAKTMKRMFKGCENLPSMPNYNYYNVTDVEEMFSGCKKMQGNYTAQNPLVKLVREPEVITEITKVQVEEQRPILDASGQPVLDENGKPTFETIIVEKEVETSTVIYNESLTYGINEAENSINKEDWWAKYKLIPVYEKTDFGTLEQTGTELAGHFENYKDCFKDCSFYNSVAIPNTWNMDYRGQETKPVFIYKCTYKLSGIDEYSITLHKYNKVESLDDMKKLGEQIKALLEARELTMVSAELLETYVKPVKQEIAE